MAEMPCYPCRRCQTGGMKQTIGDALTAALSAQGDTCREAAKIIGTSTGAISRWANDLATPTAVHAWGLMCYLDVEFEELAVMFLLSEVRRWERQGNKRHSSVNTALKMIGQDHADKTRNRCSAIWNDWSGGQITGIGPRADECAFDGIIFAYSESAYSVRTMMG